MTEPYYSDDSVTIYLGDCRELMAVLTFDCEIAATRCSQEVLGLSA